jgi:hypothetical protein
MTNGQRLAGWFLLAAMLLCPTACGGGDSDSKNKTGTAGTSGNASGDFASCDGRSAPGSPACTEWTGSNVSGALASIQQQCPASMNYTFSTTAHCSTAAPGCICVTGSEDLQQHVYIYQTDLQDPIRTAPLLCGQPVESCFGGLTAPSN